MKVIVCDVCDEKLEDNGGGYNVGARPADEGVFCLRGQYADYHVCCECWPENDDKPWYKTLQQLVP